jgi:hypothetical protein
MMSSIFSCIYQISSFISDCKYQNIQPHLCLGRFSDYHNGIDSCAFDGANSNQSSVFIRRACIDSTLDTNEIDYTTSIGGCDTATTTTTTAPTTATTTTTTKRHNHLTECCVGG